MKRIFISLSLLVLMLVINFTHIPYRQLILIAIVLLIGLNQIFLTITNSQKKFTGQLIIRKQRESVSFSIIIVATIWTILAIIGKRDVLSFTILFWIFVLTNAVSVYITTRRKPISIVVTDNEIFINEIWSTKRDLETLEKINLNGLTNTITLSFLSKSGITFSSSNYRSEDVAALIKYLIKHSKQNVELSNNLKS